MARPAVLTAADTIAGSFLLAAGLAAAVLIFLLAAILIRDSRHSSEELQSSLRDKEGENERLEVAVADRTKHLVTAQEQLLRSTSVINSMFVGMAEGALVIDGNGMIMFANHAVEKLLGYRPGMTLEELKVQNVIYRTDGTTVIPLEDIPAARAMRGAASGASAAAASSPASRRARC